MNNGLTISDRVSWNLVLSACVLEIVLGTALACTHLPLCDEGFYGVPAHVLSFTGVLRDPVLESAGVPNLRGIDRTFYWMAPMGMVAQAGAFKVFGFGLLVQRELSVVCGLGAVLFWYFALRRLVAERVASLAALFLSVDYVFLSLASRGRSDMISLSFGMAALAGYMHWRERAFTLALAAANAACALSGIVHPNGGLAALASLAVLTLCLDRKRLRWRHLAVVAVCYGLPALGWGLYIARAPDLFVSQFFGNVAGRLGGPITLSRLVKGEVARYLSAYNVQNVHGIRRVRYLLPISYFVAVFLCALTKDLRRRSRVLLLMFVAVSFTLILLEGGKQGWYLVHLSPLYCVFLAFSQVFLWSKNNLLCRAIATAQIFAIVLGVASLAYVASNRNLQRLYEPTVEFLNAHVGPPDVVFASSEFYFGLNCRNCLTDDANLGAISGKRARYIVLDPVYSSHLVDLQKKHPAMYRDIQQQLSRDYQLVFHNPVYLVFERTAAAW